MADHGKPSISIPTSDIQMDVDPPLSSIPQEKYAATPNPTPIAPTPPGPSLLDLPAFRRLREPGQGQSSLGSEEGDDFEGMSVAVNASEWGDEDEIPRHNPPIEAPIIPPSPVAPASKAFGPMSGQWKPENIERWRETAVAGEEARPGTPVGRAGEVGGELVPQSPGPATREGSPEWGKERKND
ncbi:hypothetical protein BT69DRAFT_1346552 [Atractiella rhizophila]|nr:hypothetical protein BT69DRAFT_1346552 [Atractiella rhizophila]